ncbi:S26 family signal peptidase [Arthrobacter sp. PO-11]|uniref:S26 family signal peptidase n=1 Tax=Arthrobacter cavernae TaxID=2817681 RepID=A0A939KMB6_9MICC|nr:S26 family signal peptidase [Arthrobacter cavernae]
MFRILTLSREIALTLVAVLGLLCILALVLGFLYKASFVVFRTGSMEPNYPVGALSLTVQVPAGDLLPGDVVSVKRTEASALVTHRVVSVVLPESPDANPSLTLKGDANSSQDPLPYDVATAQKVLFTVPSLGSWVMAARGPGFIGGATLAVAGLVVWAYWPKRQPRHAGNPNGSGDDSSGGE